MQPLNLLLERTYHPAGTNGSLSIDGEVLCFTIELPWRYNRRNVSCIPEGNYALAIRLTPDRGMHLHLLHVKDRSLILFHAGNDAAKDLKGCIAPVTALTGPGTGIHSQQALEKLEDLVFPYLSTEQSVKLQIMKKTPLTILERAMAPTPPFFKRIRMAGLILAAAGGAILSAPVALPAMLVTIGGYLIAGGSILSAVSQVTIDEKVSSDESDLQ